MYSQLRCSLTDVSHNELATSGAPSTSADNILATLSLVYQSSIDKDAVDASEELEEGDLVEAIDDTRKALTTSNNNTNKLEKIKKKKIHAMIGDDLWKKDILAIWMEAVRRRKKKSQVGECILHDIQYQKEIGSCVVVPEDMKYMPSWQVVFICSHTNHLNLQIHK